jgi:2-oxoisovalerate dehydrogenase E2 component (dihydrolipoyl transacylase)
MGEHTIKLPDVGEGVAEAELVEWHVKVGDPVREDDVLAAVMTDKATVEIPSPVDGEIAWLGAEVGDVMAVGSPLVRIKTAGETAEAEPEAETADPMDDGEGEAPIAEGMAEEGEHLPPPPEVEIEEAPRPSPSSPVAALRAAGEKPLASPAVRLRAREAGIDLRQVPGSGPAGRITH